ncbi:ABC transporter ATP-binding protein [Desulfoluna butyratoxydans]|uniref:Abc transporter transmembrane region n=1 Tax=Desulfoluna butyratoxydans TaxID=231438 RepID=A0A4U8YU81_9BACT|nr:ATP-binding cassette domain-containing protein [Desulfoluna butyratoxydans]VFQ47454.1 abc transporter transmembrane region [Desulfoluna butyratoxydans]
MFEIFSKLIVLHDKQERRNVLWLFGMVLIMGLLEVVGVASIMPFIAVVSNPEIIKSNIYLSFLYNTVGFTATEPFLILLGAVVFVLVLGSLIFKALANWVLARYTHMRTYSISSKLLDGYLYRPYTWFLNRHSADLSNLVLAEVQQVINYALMPAVQLISNIVVAIFLSSLIVAVDPMVALVSVATISCAYVFIYVILRKYLKAIGVQRLNSNLSRYQVVQEAFGGIKEVKVMGLECAYSRNFRNHSLRFAQCQAMNQIIGQLPRFALEGLVFGGMLILMLTLLVSRGGELGEVLPMLVLYAFAGTRLMPALQQIYLGMTRLRFGKPALDKLHKEFKIVAKVSHSGRCKCKSPEPVLLNSRLELRNIRYTYPLAEKSSLIGLNLEIPAKSTVAIVGSTGAGKTTAVDLILGLIIPQEGELIVDGVPVTEQKTLGWQRSIGYVPQHIFLTDNTVAGNIAFGVPQNDIDRNAVMRAAKIAELHDFVMNDLPSGYDTMIGEQGVRLSGGQRQRIGIARSLYHDPNVLILDEATSALDNSTEKKVMDTVHSLGQRKTVIMIAHRLSTVQDCDIIFLLENGELIDSGTYDDLITNNKSFQSMVAAAVNK